MNNIKFSQETKEFLTGAHRGGGDKYPMEYLPLLEAGHVLAIASNTSPCTTTEACVRIAQKVEEFKTSRNPSLLAEAGAIAAVNLFKNLYDCMGLTALHFKQGAEKYGFNNWQKGMPVMVYIGSLSRHLFKFLAGWTDEPHETAIMWNILALMWTVQNKPEMNDLLTFNETTEPSKCVMDVEIKN